MAAAATQACSDRPAHAGSDRDCNSNEIARRLLLLALTERPAADTAVDGGGVDPVAPPRKRRSKQEKELLDSAAARCSGCADGSAAVTPWCSGLESDGASWKLSAAGRCVHDPPDAGVCTPLADAPPPSADGGGATRCAGARCRAAAEVAPHDAGLGSSVCGTDRSRRPSSSVPDGCEDASACVRAVAAAEEGAATTAAPNRCGNERLRDEQRLLTTRSPLRPPCDGCPAGEEPAAGSCDERSRPPDDSTTPASRDGDGSGAAGPGAACPPGQTVVVLRRKTQQRTVDVVARRRSSRLSQNKRLSVTKIGAASSALAEKAASLRQKFISLKARTKGMQQKDTEIKVKFQDLQKRRNVLKSLSRSSVVRVSKLGSVLLELGDGGGGAGALV